MNHRLLIVLTTLAVVIWAGYTGALMHDEDLPFGTAALISGSILAAAAIGGGLLIAALNWASRGDR